MLSEPDRETRLEYLRPDEILAERNHRPLVFLPTGCIEWHGPHLPLGVDVILAHEVAVRLARKVGGVVHPCIFCGTERERRPEMLRDIGFQGDEWVVGMDFPANALPSPYYPEEIFALMVREALSRLVELGYRLIAIVNGHGAENQIATLHRLAALFSARTEARVEVLLPFPEEQDETGTPTTAAGHADIYETSAMLALHPTRVDLDRLPALDYPLRNVDWAVVDGPTFSGRPTPQHTVRTESDPRYATSEAGSIFLEEIVSELAERVRESLRQIRIEGARNG
ncbi:MAG: creatininase family protein [Anaerolineae bacterium]|nr:creatininase family protein [Anaerolineae bacterium]